MKAGARLMGGGHAMEARRSRRQWTYAEFARLPSEGSTRYEVIDGELVVTPSPTSRHQAVVTELSFLLHGFVRARGLGRVLTGPVDVLLAEGDYLTPDLVFVGKDRVSGLSDRGVEGPPDLVVEVLSPSTEHRDRGVKVERYRHFGVVEYWIVDPEARTIEIWGLAGGTKTPTVLGAADTLRWTPAEDATTLAIPLAEFFGNALG
jgi:Uma2 family endonuclease